MVENFQWSFNLTSHSTPPNYWYSQLHGEINSGVSVSYRISRIGLDSERTIRQGGVQSRTSFSKNYREFTNTFLDVS